VPLGDGLNSGWPDKAGAEETEDACPILSLPSG
jgi:hypothetical protein